MGESKRKYLSRDGVVKSTIVDSDYPDRLVVHTQQDVAPILDGIARDREIMPNTGHNKHVARLPLFVVEDLILRGIYFDHDAFKRWLNSYECDPWRIWGGTV